MVIDERIEEHVREAYRGAIAHDIDRIIAAFRDLNEKDLITATGYGLHVCAHIVGDIYPDGVPENGLRDLAQKIVDTEGKWIKMSDAETVAKLLDAAAKGDPTLGEIDRETVMVATFVCGAHLLSRYRLENQRAWEYLDEIWNTAEAQADSGPDQTR